MTPPDATRRPLIAGNWKLWGTRAHAEDWCGRLHVDAELPVDVGICPPFTALEVCVEKLKGTNVAVYAQNMHHESTGAYTGEISAAMLAKLGCSYVVVGHSERRMYHQESDELVNAKAHRALAAGMTPIVCVGEGLDVRKAGEQVPFTLAQVDGSLAGFTSEQVAGLVIAYEPVWAIGTGEVATPDDAQEVCGAIRERIREVHGDGAADGVRIQYGGSVKAANVAGIMEKPDVDGCLVGGASLQVDEFGGICRFHEMPVL
jgi:triosephosphate isomerase (TIM)